MGETLDETRVEIAAQRADLEATAAHLRDSLDIGKRVRENPAAVIGIGATVAFLVAGGPRRLARILRRRMSPNAAEQAYDALPATMQAWVSALAGEAGPKASKIRDELVSELQRWRRDPVKDKKARKELARQMVEGPPGPGRAAWTAAETALGLVAAALTRKAIERFLTNESSSAAAPARSSAAKPRGDVGGPTADSLSGWSGRDKPVGD